MENVSSANVRNWDALFTPFTLGKLSLSTRIVMAPMTRAFSPGGVPGENVAGYYRRRAENGVGLIVTEGTTVNHPSASLGVNTPRFHGEDALAGWAAVVKAVHEAGGAIVPQLWHVGMERSSAGGEVPHPEAPAVGPSGLNLAGEPTGESLSRDDIAAIVRAFGQAAADAKRIGFDGIELHGAHGYLIDQFLWSHTNRRTDEYGGSLAARTRFAAEIVRACREAAGPDFPIIFRISQWKIGHYDAKLAETPEQLAELLAPLVDAGVDIFHCSTRRFQEPEFAGSELNFAGWVKKLTGKPVITVGSIGLSGEGGSTTAGLPELAARLEAGEFDLAAVGRALLVDPAWAAKVRDGRTDELLPFAQEAFATLT
ncbi:NADH:flavin oxidoreductase [Paenibacillus athensensis]|uniref:12-oxophytodienoate reductase n=1 Tax=Paenibacillus athensensis TaxID=1967502 RepID=A0A4Y8Q0R7_9BACL|nr:NADH:flavin oxidoreductase [Paenibacillus athensensis]MCD1258577.1 NADH:flavin oxidoreductase [Paenibacillus athensensis]